MNNELSSKFFSQVIISVKNFDPHCGSPEDEINHFTKSYSPVYKYLSTYLGTGTCFRTCYLIKVWNTTLSRIEKLEI